MTVSQTQLALLYFNACLLGVGLGVFYGLLRIVRIFFGDHFSMVANRFQAVELPFIHVREKRKRHGRLLKVIVFAEDFLFCVVAAVAMILLFYQINNGKLRFLAFPVAGVGFYLYRITLGRLVMVCSETVAFVLEAAIRYVFFFLLFPLKWIVNRIVLIIRKRWRRFVEKRRARQRALYTKEYEKQLDIHVKRVLLGREKEKGVRRDVGRKQEEAVQPEPDGTDFSGGHRSGVHRRIRQ